MTKYEELIKEVDSKQAILEIKVEDIESETINLIEEYAKLELKLYSSTPVSLDTIAEVDKLMIKIKDNQCLDFYYRDWLNKLNNIKPFLTIRYADVQNDCFNDDETIDELFLLDDESIDAQKLVRTINIKNEGHYL